VLCSSSLPPIHPLLPAPDRVNFIAYSQAKASVEQSEEKNSNNPKKNFDF
jgi:hypothetical protein